MTPLDTPAALSTASPADAPVLTIPADAPFFVVMNAGSGRRQTDPTRAVLERELGGAGRRFELRLVDDPAELAASARMAVEDAIAQSGVVVGAGGDGTLCAVAQATLGSGCPFAVLPRGTFNYFSRDHGIPADLDESTRLLLTARAYPVQVGVVNGRDVPRQRESRAVSQAARRPRDLQAPVRPQPPDRAAFGGARRCCAGIAICACTSSTKDRCAKSAPRRFSSATTGCNSNRSA